MKKILAFVLVLGMLLSFAACGKKDVPDGYQLASNEKVCDYALFVPVNSGGEKWRFESASSDFTTAALTVTEEVEIKDENGEGTGKTEKVDKLACTVSMAMIGTLQDNESVEMFWDRYKESYTFLTNCTASEAVGVVLNEENGNAIGKMEASGISYTFKGDYNGTTYHYTQVLFSFPIDNGETYPVYCVTYTAMGSDFYSKYLETFDGILENIVLR